MIGRDCTRSREPFNEPDEATQGIASSILVSHEEVEMAAIGPGTEAYFSNLRIAR